jgi:hypothetical protein
MRVLVACEFSGVVRDAFLAAGHDAVSCDLLPCERPGPHAQGDARKVVRAQWDLVIAHPPCTYLCNSGVRWLSTEPGRYDKMLRAVEFFFAMYNANSSCVAVENPIMHGYASERLPSYTQIIHPWQHGHGETKATCLWLRGLPPLQPSNTVEGREAKMHRLSPSATRWAERSRTYEGIAKAMAAQWGSL